MADRTRAHRDSRSRSPRRHNARSHRTRSPRPPHERRRLGGSTEVAAPPPATLPFNARQLNKHDFTNLRPMFALYLDIQKGKILDEMDETEAKGRWKSFVGKWNRGELSEGWYDPETFVKAVKSASEPSIPDGLDRRRSSRPAGQTADGKGDEGDSDDSIGPTLPGQESRSKHSKAGPSIPSMQDLELKREMNVEDGLARRDDIRFARKLDRKEQKAVLDELVPRAEAGTRERQLEKKKEVNEKMKSFRERSPGAAEVPDSELMGGGDGMDSYKKEKQEYEKKKNERELRKEEFLRARQAEREERLQEYRVKEEGTMAMLKALAKQRFG